MSTVECCIDADVPAGSKGLNLYAFTQQIANPSMLEVSPLASATALASVPHLLAVGAGHLGRRNDGLPCLLCSHETNGSTRGCSCALAATGSKLQCTVLRGAKAHSRPARKLASWLPSSALLSAWKTPARPPAAQPSRAPPTGEVVLADALAAAAAALRVCAHLLAARARQPAGQQSRQQVWYRRRTEYGRHERVQQHRHTMYA